MNIKGIYAIAAFASTTWGSASGNHLRSYGQQEQSSRVEPDTNLMTSGKACSFEGTIRQAGQWLEGPSKTCQCERYGTGEWVDCIDNPDNQDTGPDPNTTRGRRQQFNDKDFVFDLLGSVPAAITSAGTIQPLDVGNLPSLAGQGLSYTLITIEPCGINLPHVHPRATELIYVIGGKDLRTAFVEENGGRVIVNDIGMGEVTFFPAGLIHYQQNLSCETTTYIAALSSEDPGVVTVSTQFFMLPDEAVQGSLGQDKSYVRQLIDGLPAGPADGRKSCINTCKWAADHAQKHVD